MWCILFISSLVISSSLVSSSPFELTTSGQVINDEVNSNGLTSAPGQSDIWDDVAEAKPSGSNTDQSESVMLTSSHPMIVSTSQGDTTGDNPGGNTGDTSCFPGFSCSHGVCTGGMSCACFDGWAGLFCDHQCPSDCAPLGTCVTSSINQPVCVCNDTSTYTPGEGCVETTQAIITTTADIPITTPSNMRPLWERECQGVFTCMYGYCQVASLACDCDPGWKGQICDQPCDLTCGDYGRCRENQQYLQYCECDNSHDGDHCENDIYHNTTTSTAASPTASPAVTKTWDFSDWFYVGNVASGDTVFPREAAETPQRLSTTAATTLRPKSERVCDTGLECKHGYCVENQFSCMCDNGWGGLLCGDVCDLSCGVNETCHVPLAGSPYCGSVDGGGDYGGYDKHGERLNMEAANRNSSGSEYWHDLEQNYGQMPPYDQRFCEPDFICAYGNCSDTQEEGIKCSCLKGFIGIFCQTPCPLECGLNGDCIYNNYNETFECHCHHGFTGVNCTDTWDVFADSGNYPIWIMVCMSTALLLMSIVLIVLVPILLYRRQNITMMKVKYWFQRFEDDDNRRFDGFVSYASSDMDRQFVLQVLVPKLEGRMCFTLCIHQRNFVPGQFISDNIVESVKQSRRTLLILSPSFVSSGWCRFEYQMALQEMLNEKHRVLPIIIGDIKSVMGEIDDTLKRILKTVTWLEYPTKNASEQDLENFWKRLHLSMPKKRSSQQELDKCRSCLVSPHSHLSLKPSQDNTILATPTTFTVESANRRLLQRIFKVPGSGLSSSDKTLSTSSLDRALESHPDTDSKNGNVGSSLVETDLHPDIDSKNGTVRSSSTHTDLHPDINSKKGTVRSLSTQTDLHPDIDSKNGTVRSSSTQTALHPDIDSNNATVGLSLAETDLHPDTDFKKGTDGSATAETGLHPQISEPSFAGKRRDIVENLKFSRLKSGPPNSSSKNNVSNYLKTDLLVSLPNVENHLECAVRNEDVPKCMLDTYLGNIDVNKNVPV